MNYRFTFKGEFKIFIISHDPKLDLGEFSIVIVVLVMVKTGKKWRLLINSSSRSGFSQGYPTNKLLEL